MKKLLESAWGALQIGFHLALGPVLHRWRTSWGATPEEIGRALPGDEFVPAPSWKYDHALTIDAPRSAVWPWVVQLGQGRAGFYTYEGLENLVGCDIHNVAEIRPDLQALKVGDRISMHPRAYAPPIAILEPERAMVLAGPPDEKGNRASWSFYLFDGPGGTTRFLERGRSKPGEGFLSKLGFGPYLIDPIGFVMSRKMLRTIKRLAEATA